MDSLTPDGTVDLTAELEPGTLLGPNLVVRGVLGAGGTATVYEVRDVRSDQTLAAKVCAAHNLFSEEARARLLREVKIHRSLRDERLPKIHSIHELRDGSIYIVMEKVSGTTLSGLLEQGPLPIDLACRITMELLDVLDVVHRHGIVHRDIKPSNVMVEDTSSLRPRLRLIDFGVCKVTPSGPNVPAITRPGEIVGTPSYMAPEQLMGQPLDGRVDVHGAGVLLFELLTGRPPFASSSFGELVAAVLRDTAESVRVLRPEVPEAIADVVQKALAKAPADRFASARDMREALYDATHEKPTRRSTKAEALVAKAGLADDATGGAPRETGVRTVKRPRAAMEPATNEPIALGQKR